MSKLTRLELAALVTALSGSKEEVVRELVLKIPLLRVFSRKQTGVGFYTEFNDYEDSENKALMRSNIPPIEAIGFHPDFHGVANFIIWLRDGKINCLEGAATGYWPADEGLFVLCALPS
jgi:hypothetical protein